MRRNEFSDGHNVEFDYKQEIQAAQVKLLFEQLPSALFATVINAAILTAVLWREVSTPLLLGWLLVIFFHAVARYGHGRAYLRSTSSSAESLRWARQYLYGVASNGLLWGFASFFFFTAHSYVHQVFLAFVLMGMVSGGISTLSALRGAYLVFVVPALIPYGVQLLRVGGELHLAMAVMLVVYLTVMTTIGHRLYATGRESLRLRFENVGLLQDLTQAKQHQELVNRELSAQVVEKHIAQAALQKACAELETRVEERTAELAKSGEALRNADRRKDEFLAMLGHELRNPLAPIRNALQIMQNPDVPDYTVKWAREVIDRQVNRLTRIVDDLLDVSRIVYGKINLHETPLEIATLINQAVEGSLPFLEERHQKLSVRISEETLWVKGDLVRLEQVISNLLNNAAKYSEVGEQIRLEVEASENWVTVRVQDNGIGISSEAMPYIFDLFAQANHSLAGTQSGLGIGLTVVKRLVEMHGGRVEAHSQGTGHGAEFLVHLPRREALAQTKIRVQQHNPAHRSKSPIRVLVVDDNQDAVESLALLLSLEGYTVVTACNGITALDEAVGFQPHVVLLDIGMPGMDGYDVARELRAREQTSSTTIIALTGYGQPEDRARAVAAGFTDHLTKPVNPDVLYTLLKAHLVRH
jgi:signal transduction histidine kinase/ActR/RegA family two-component response regulator